ncbi:hypothetical protein LJR235_005374 [Pararhizobium sp. LjRoot235]|uniref:hypothetical protein n=1 Tax=Pararhizobium sp. LjRoot235 TaxID=3342291 RepID=UPI003ECFA709
MKKFLYLYLQAFVFALTPFQPAAAEDYFVKPIVHQAEFSEPDVANYWPEYPEVLQSGATQITVQTTAEGQALTISMKIDSKECTLRDCPIRIFRDGVRIGQRMACRDVQTFLVSRDGDYIKMCGLTYAVADLTNIHPRNANKTRPYWEQMAEELVLNHNGSAMRVLPHEGKILYLEPRKGLSPAIKSGQVLFEGRPWTSGGAFSGMAYTFRKGCPPAPYRVEAFYEGSVETLTLRGAAPVRENKGCKVVGYTLESDNATLQFHTTFD